MMEIYICAYMYIFVHMYVYNQRYIKFTKKCKEPKIAKTILEMMNKVERLILPDFKIYYKAALVKT